MAGDPLYVLDVDLDAFLSDTVHWTSGRRRVSKKHYVPWSRDQLRDFLEGQCGLSRDTSLPSRFAIDHDAALAYFEALHDQSGRLLELAHLDGHADLGLGDPSWVHLVTEWLAKAPAQRCQPPKGKGYCNPGSFLAYAAAERLLAGVTYAFPEGGGDDFHTIFFKDNNPAIGFLELKGFNLSSGARDYETLTIDRAISVEPEIAYRAMSINEFRAARSFDRGFVCQSPAFTPKASDELLYVLAEYMVFDADSHPLP